MTTTEMSQGSVRRPSRRTLRWAVPVTAAAVTAGVAVIATAPGASGSEHPPLPARTAAQLLADLHGLNPAPFHGTVVETARLGLPSLPSGDLNVGGGSLGDVFTLLTGSHTAQVSYGGPGLQRVAVFTGESTETDVVHNGTNVWMYRSNDNTVSHYTLPKDQADGEHDTPASALTPEQAAEQALAAIDPTTKVSVDLTARVADRPAYQLVLSPKASGTTISSVKIAVDSATHLPLRVQVWGSATDAPAVEIAYTDFSTSAPGSRTFEFDVPAGAKVTQEKGDPKGTHEQKAKGDGTTVVGTAWNAVVVATLPKDSSGKPNAATGLLNQLGTPTAQGTLVRSALVNVLVTPDGRVAAGAVTPDLLAKALS